MDTTTSTDHRPGPDDFRVLPSVADLVRTTRTVDPRIDQEVLTGVVQAYLDDQRRRITAGERPSREEIERGARQAIARLTQPRLTPALNATGVLIHTNLGRAPVSRETASAMAEAAASAVALELDPETNQRGGRMDEISALMRPLTGAGATLVVNNGAAALLLALSAIAAGRNVIVSRGEAVEIGGGFRIPEVIAQSGANLVEIGTTNRTYVTDYARATDESTAAYLKVHPSNFTLAGFVHRPTVQDLARLGSERGIPVVEDLGSGALLDTSAFGLAREPTIADSLGAGAALVTASGDKLLGGPQAGIICGGADWIARVARHPLARAVRADKTCLAGLAATLRHYLHGNATTTVPIWRMVAASPEEIRSRAEAAQLALAGIGIPVTVTPVRSSVGGGSLPGQELASFALACEGRADDRAHRLRSGRPAVFARVERNRLLLDLRAILPEDDQRLLAAIRNAWSKDGPETPSSTAMVST